MPKGWISKRIGELGRVVTGKTPSTKIPEHFDGPYPFITIPDLDGRLYITDTSRTLSEKGATSIQGAQLPAGAVMISCIATVGRCGITSKPSFTNQQINSVIPNNGVDARFLYYAFTQLGKELERAGGGGSVYTNVSKSRFSNISVRIPGRLSEQQDIAAILGALDDKIELNRRMSETLEGIAATVFQSWFVAFDGAEHLETSDLGLIPKGWRFEPIGNLIEVVGGSTPSTKEPSYWEGGYLPWATPKDLSGHEGPVLLKTARSITDAGLERISSGLLPKGTLLFSSRAPIGYRAIAGQSMAVNQGFIAVPPGGELSPTYMYFWTHSNLDVITGHAGGSTFAEISKRSFRSIPAVLPPMELRHRFDEVAGVILRRCEIQARESETLAELRDTLLPKLISGELRIPEAEQLVSEVA